MVHRVAMTEVPSLGLSVSTFLITVLDWNSVISTSLRRGMTHNLGRDLRCDQSRWDIVPRVYVSWNNATEWCKIYSELTNTKYQLMSLDEWAFLTRFNPKITKDVTPSKDTICQVTSDPNQYGLWDLKGSYHQWVCDDHRGWKWAVGLHANPTTTLYSPTFVGKKSLGFRITTTSTTDKKTFEFLCGMTS